MRYAFLFSVCFVPALSIGCGSGNDPQLNSSREELDAFLVEHPEGLHEEVSLDGQ
ncbi:hypothetical protein SAMN06265222_111123 [Neorhodopirellula lusitana]|uniref:Secreted protein n=1 Tax=Neorhodopirellula lusitana TaxID=445327 RepID=A0ABY1QHL7_9BACT|nr:hypothetical protein [Neorhodopirellula lusitana]SMP68877.1 hypothetical protein SAMN06265222_111123 [Neorhodopirellula lusitana]